MALSLVLADTTPRPPPPPASVPVDAARSQVGFQVRTRWNQTLLGRFTRMYGTLQTEADGRGHVQLWLDSGSAEIDRSAALTERMHGRQFFDAQRHPQLRFASDPFPIALLHDGGELDGTVTIRDISRRERFRIRPADCDRPGLDCPVQASGRVQRRHYGMRRMQLLLRDEVVLDLSIRLQAAVPADSP